MNAPYLPQHFRFHAWNATGDGVVVTLKVDYFKFDADGALVFAAAATELNGVSVANGAGEESATRDNSENLYLGGVVEFTVVGETNCAGPVEIYLQASVDGGTTWPTDRYGILVGVVQVGASETIRTNFPV